MKVLQKAKSDTVIQLLTRGSNHPFRGSFAYYCLPICAPQPRSHRLVSAQAPPELYERMVFVYTGKGRRSAQKDDAPPEQKACAKQACAIQWCLAKRDHKEHLCRAVIDEWKECCEKVRGTVDRGDVES